MLLVAALADIVASRNHRQLLPSLGVLVAQTPAEVRVKAVERNVETLDFSNAEAPLPCWLTARSQASENSDCQTNYAISRISGHA